jgi:hypothetical protein
MPTTMLLMPILKRELNTCVRLIAQNVTVLRHLQLMLSASTKGHHAKLYLKARHISQAVVAASALDDKPLTRPLFTVSKNSNAWDVRI